MAAHRLSLVAAIWHYFSLWYAGFSFWWLTLCGSQALAAKALVIVACGLSSCGEWTQLLHSMWDLYKPGI